MVDRRSVPLARPAAVGATLFDTSNHLVSRRSASSCSPARARSRSSLFGRTAPWLGAAAGSVALAVGLLLIVLRGGRRAPAALLLVGAVVGGAGFGVAFLGALRALSAAIPPEHRAQVMSAFYVVAYASLSVPAILAGIVVTPLGLQTTFEIFGSVVAAIALVVALEAWRTRPQSRPVAVGLDPVS